MGYAFFSELPTYHRLTWDETRDRCYCWQLNIKMLEKNNSFIIVTFLQLLITIVLSVLTIWVLVLDYPSAERWNWPCTWSHIQDMDTRQSSIWDRLFFYPTSTQVLISFVPSQGHSHKATLRECSSARSCLPHRSNRPCVSGEDEV